MKRKLAVVLSAAMIASLTACGSPTGDPVVSNQENVGESAISTEQTEILEEVKSESETEEVTEKTEKKEEKKKKKKNKKKNKDKATEQTESETKEETQTETAESETKEETQTETVDKEEKESETKETEKTEVVVSDTVQNISKPVAENTNTSEKPEKDKVEQPSKKPDKSDKTSNKTDNSSKPSSKPSKPSSKPEDSSKPSNKPEEKPSKPSKPSSETDEPSSTESEATDEKENETVANTLFSNFKTIAKSGNTESIANTLIGNSIIPFMGMAVPVEEGWLSGFGDTEITGFKEGAMFGPMIGSIPFIGYVFEVKDDTDVNQFISQLKSNADLRWNVCTEADEMMVGSVDKKVFFIMCPKYFKE